MISPEFKNLMATAEPARLGPEERVGRLTLPEIDERLKPALSDKAEIGPLVRSLVYLWHDHLDASHKISQEIETADGSLVHGMMHRREPDYWNSKYWFRRVGKHPAFLKLALDAEEMLARAGDKDLLSRLVPNKTWDPFAFVDAVEDSVNGPFKSKVSLLEQIQKLEFEAVLDSFAGRF
jgi:hypothetical protein